MKRHRLTALGEDQTGVVDVTHLAARHGSILKLATSDHRSGHTSSNCCRVEQGRCMMHPMLKPLIPRPAVQQAGEGRASTALVAGR